MANQQSSWALCWQIDHRLAAISGSLDDSVRDGDQAITIELGQRAHLPVPIILLPKPTAPAQNLETHRHILQ
ncbi:hypothetical protein EAS61_26480 [Bradyrhizobium zhanjiangense]|uniref:Uncharacterized protein n=1 Tax=Bradyrhizobium zhanjiangense TaxID=1325107 RepID=A0A4Q0QHI2_9BRAD|nr:hypothetical protein EAS61_26480 [Bradyrhizobium zhanjiangense]